MRRSTSRRDLQHEALRGGVAQAIFRHQFVLCTPGWRNLQTMLDCRMQLFDWRLDPYRLRAIDAIADVGALPASDGVRTCVEIQNLELAPTQDVDGSPRLLDFHRLARPLRFVGIAPSGIEEPAIVCGGGKDRDSQERQRLTEQRKHYRKHSAAAGHGLLEDVNPATPGPD